MTTTISPTAQQAMGSTALEFSDNIVATTDPMLYAIFERIENGTTSFEQEEQQLLSQWQTMLAQRSLNA